MFMYYLKFNSTYAQVKFCLSQSSFDGPDGFDLSEVCCILNVDNRRV